MPVISFFNEWMLAFIGWVPLRVRRLLPIRWALAMAEFLATGATSMLRTAQDAFAAHCNIPVKKGEGERQVARWTPACEHVISTPMY